MWTAPRHFRLFGLPQERPAWTRRHQMADNVRRLPAPADSQRVENGPVQFGTDWPGLFIRGDSAFGLAMSIKAILAHFKEHPAPEVFFAIHDLKGLYKDILTEVIIGGTEMYKEEGKLTPGG